MDERRQQTTGRVTLVRPVFKMDMPDRSHTANHLAETCLCVGAEPYLVPIIDGRCVIPIDIVEVAVKDGLGASCCRSMRKPYVSDSRAQACATGIALEMVRSWSAVQCEKVIWSVAAGTSTLNS